MVSGDWLSGRLVVAGRLGAGGASSANRKEGAGLRGDHDARDPAQRAPQHVSLRHVSTLGHRDRQDRL